MDDLDFANLPHLRPIPLARIESILIDADEAEGKQLSDLTRSHSHSLMVNIKDPSLKIESKKKKKRQKKKNRIKDQLNFIFNLLYFYKKEINIKLIF